MNAQLSERLKNFLLKKFPDAKLVSGKRQIAMRCRFCGDSRKDKTTTHFYISLGLDNKPPMYHCFKCQESGIVTPKLLKSLVDCSDDIELLLDIKHDNNDLLRRGIIKKDNHVFHRLNNFIIDSRLNKTKLKYINKRLGLNLSYKDLYNDKIVLNLLDLLNYNHINKYNRSIDNMNELSSYFIGFLSMDNGFVNLRNLAKPGVLSKYVDYRYVNYNIFDSLENSRRFYTIPTNCNVLYPIDIHIAEGPFDILSIFYNLRNANRIQNIYTSAKGKAYANVIKLYIEEYGIINAKIHLYVDNDVSNDELEFSLNKVKGLDYQVFIHRNIYNNEKDFGVALNKIKEYTIRI
jgi:hypothetical protein